LVHDFRGFSLWAAGSVAVDSGEVEHHSSGSVWRSLHTSDIAALESLGDIPDLNDNTKVFKQKVEWKAWRAEDR
jgi:hypothetical protein